ncbi:hypothetical protein J6590_040903 [Homalodisca vitripennis]|nr:hypothetical protein J6590_040903 [Homalodisca vitripennis]
MEWPLVQPVPKEALHPAMISLSTDPLHSIPYVVIPSRAASVLETASLLRRHTQEGSTCFAYIN